MAFLSKSTSLEECNHDLKTPSRSRKGLMDDDDYAPATGSTASLTHHSPLKRYDDEIPQNEESDDLFPLKTNRHANIATGLPWTNNKQAVSFTTPKFSPAPQQLLKLHIFSTPQDKNRIYRPTEAWLSKNGKGRSDPCSRRTRGKEPVFPNYTPSKGTRIHGFNIKIFPEQIHLHKFTTPVMSSRSLEKPTESWLSKHGKDCWNPCSHQKRGKEPVSPNYTPSKGTRTHGANKRIFPEQIHLHKFTTPVMWSRSFERPTKAWLSRNRRRPPVFKSQGINSAKHRKGF